MTVIACRLASFYFHIPKGRNFFSLKTHPLRRSSIVILALIFVPLMGLPQSAVQRPKLVVGIIVDQMRWDYLYRYYDRYDDNGGFKRMLAQGFSCENTMIPYSHTVTACGHASVYTGTVPAIHGITGNEWWDRTSNNYVYCTGDEAYKTVGSATAETGTMSPSNMKVTTICDELKLATNSRSKVIGIALKDRGGILPAGHTADAAYWYDSKSGKWVSSTYYLKELPAWVNAFNAKKLPDSLYAKDWNTLYPLNTYVQSSKDNKPYENRIFGTGFPYTLQQFVGRNYNPILATPHGNTLTSAFAREVVINEKMGAGNETDFLAISFSTPDYVGHSFGPNSVEQEDVFLRLDRELGEFLDFLDARVGKGQYLLFLTSDHGGAHVPGFLREQRIPNGNVMSQALADSLNMVLKAVFKQDGIVATIVNYQVVLNDEVIEAFHLNRQEIKDWLVLYLAKHPGIARAIDLEKLSQATLNSRIKEMIANSYYPGRSGDIQLVYDPQWIDGFEKSGSTHGIWNPYDAHVPLVWYGWHIRQGKENKEVNIIDIAPTLAALLKIQMPSGCTGKVIEKITE